MLDFNLTTLLQRASNGDGDARNALWSLVLPEIRSLAIMALSKQPTGGAFEPSMMVSEVYMKLQGASEVKWESRKHFFGAVSRAFDQILIDHARARNAAKRGGTLGQSLGSLATSMSAPSAESGTPIPSDLIDVDAEDDSHLWTLLAMPTLQAEAGEAADVFRLRVLFGLSTEQTAAALEITTITVKNRLRFARAFFAERLKQRKNNGRTPESGDA